ncbi:ABC transporter ATP-binding protein [Vallitalea pronyensis]|uniref:ABC transporter ATP-binding protein n=1 Tax=Vallitalea pronyensis TaxID=1348613 RepID=A0A8J8SHY5_9FIRM|nr:ABC transporter ATP-binding protein [Vallitalea pronyensis]QUI23908.1 ABC transporter ATP-binding protein [Vallitalea pronyensis]
MKALFDLIKDKKTPIIICVILAALGSLLLIVPFVLIFKIVDYYLQQGAHASPEPLLSWLGIAFLALVVRYLLIVSSFVFSHIAAFDLLYRIRVRLTMHIGRLPMGFWGKKNSGEMLKIVQDDVESVEGFVAHHFPDAASGFTLPMATLIYLFSLDWRMALMATIPLPVTLVLLCMMWHGILTGQNRQELTKKYHKAIERMHSTMLEFVHGMPVVKMFNLNVHSFKKLKESIRTYREIVIVWSKGAAPYRALVATFILGGGLFILPMGIYLLQTGKTDASTIILFILLGTGCFQGLLKAIMLVTRMEFITAGIKRINEVLAVSPLEEPRVPVEPKAFDVQMHHVGFKYDKQGPEILKDVQLSLPEGSFTALVGPSGAGKTTIVNLMARMWEVTNGLITIGGIPLQEMGTQGITECVGTVFQDVQMLTDTVRENIAMGNRRASLDEIKSAAKAAACHDFIMQLPKGYNTVIGEGGETHLSGGEKQRIALARVILKDTPIILLDEATAYADAENETLMQEAFSKLMKGKTVIVIAHRLSTIVGADQIVVVDQGKIYEKGTHDELLQLNGLYNSMWHAHTRAKAWHLAQKEVHA